MSTGEQGWSIPSDNDDSTPIPSANPYSSFESAPVPSAAPQYGQYGAVAPGQPLQTSLSPTQPGQVATPQYGQYGQASGSAAPMGFVLAPKPGIVPLRPLNMGEIFEGAFNAIRVNPRTMFFTSIVVMAITGVFSAFSTFLYTNSVSPFGYGSGSMSVPTGVLAFGSSVLNVVLTSLATVVLTGLLIVAVSRAVLGRIADPSYVWQHSKGKIWPLIGQSILIGVITTFSLAVFAVVATLLIGGMAFSASSSDSGAMVVVMVLLVIVLLLACFAGALFFTVKLSLASAALVLEDLGVFESLRRSWNLTKGFFWRLLGILMLTTLLVTIATSILGGGIGMVGGAVMVAFPRQPMSSLL